LPTLRDGAGTVSRESGRSPAQHSADKLKIKHYSFHI
jgi:hypothetical protein